MIEVKLISRSSVRTREESKEGRSEGFLLVKEGSLTSRFSMNGFHAHYLWSSR